MRPRPSRPEGRGADLSQATFRRSAVDEYNDKSSSTSGHLVRRLQGGSARRPAATLWAADHEYALRTVFVLVVRGLSTAHGIDLDLQRITLPTAKERLTGAHGRSNRYRAQFARCATTTHVLDRATCPPHSSVRIASPRSSDETSTSTPMTPPEIAGSVIPESGDADAKKAERLPGAP